ncbi:hypothetical protein BDV12DRAFT_201720 [Aspergillus spectabilis]
MPAHILTGPFNASLDLTEETTRHIAYSFANHLQQVGYTAYEVRTAYNSAEDVWQFLVNLPGPVEDMPPLQVLHEVIYLFDAYVEGSWVRFGAVRRRVCLVLLTGHFGVFGCCFQPCHPIWSFPQRLLILSYLSMASDLRYLVSLHPLAPKIRYGEGGFFGCPGTRPVLQRAGTAWVNRPPAPLPSLAVFRNPPGSIHISLALLYWPIAKLPHPFHIRVFDKQALELQWVDAIGAGHWILASLRGSRTKDGLDMSADRIEMLRTRETRLDAPVGEKVEWWTLMDREQPALSPSVSVPFLFLPAFQSPVSYHMTPKKSPFPQYAPHIHMNGFKPWAPPLTKPFPPHKTPNACNPRPPRPPSPFRRKPSHGSSPSTLPLPKHHLPARPPAEVCVLVSANTQPHTPSSSHIQRRETLRPDSESKTFSEEPDRGAASPRNLVPHIQAPDPITRCDPQDKTSISTEAPAFQGDYAEDGRSSPSISSSHESLEESFRPPDERDDIPIDPLILTNDGSWKDIDLHLSIPQDNSLINLETTCPYPDPPATLHSPLNHYRDASERNVGEDNGTQTSDRDRQKVHHSPHSTDPGSSYPDSAQGDHHVDGGSKSSKRKIQQSEGQARKRYRVRSTLPPREDSFTAVQSHFVSLPLNERLQFLSWLFEGALPRCTSDSSSPTAYEDGEACVASRSSPQPEIEQSPGVCNGVQGSSRKGMPWSAEEADLLVKLQKDEGRRWSEVTRVFSTQYPGRSRGAIQVFWYTTLSKKEG